MAGRYPWHHLSEPGRTFTTRAMGEETVEYLKRKLRTCARAQGLNVKLWTLGRTRLVRVERVA